MYTAHANIFLDDTLKISADFLASEYKIPVATIRQGANRSIKGGSWQYTICKDGRKYIDTDTIPVKTRVKYDIPGKDDLLSLSKHIQQEERVTREEQKEFQRVDLAAQVHADPGDRHFYSKVLFGYKNSNAELIRRCITDYTRLAGWMRLVLSVESKDLHVFGFKDRVSFYAHVMDLINAEHLHNFNIKNVRTFLKKLKPFREWSRDKDNQELRENALRSLISKRLGNRNNQKMTEAHVQQVVKLARDGRQLAPFQIAQDLNIVAERTGMKTVSRETIRAYLRRPELANRIAYDRVGKMEWINEKMFSITREGASVPDALWWIDGTPVELFYYDKESKSLKRLELITVIDDYSKCIVGYAIGPENSDNVYRAVKSAVKFRGTIAHQITSDKGAALQSKVIQEWFKILFGDAYGHTPSTAGLARAKIIEPYQARFRQQFLSREINHSFGNITSKGPQANPEHIKRYKKYFPQGEQEVKEQIEKHIRMYNEAVDSKGNSPLSLHAEHYDDRRTISPEQFTELFYLWLPKTVTYRLEGLKIQRNDQVSTYLAPVPISPGSTEQDCLTVAQFSNSNVDRRFNVKFDPDDPERVALYYKGHFVAYAYTKEKTKRALYDTNQADGKLLQKFLLVQSMQKDDAKHFGAENDRYIEANGLLKQGFSTAQIHKNTRNEATTDVKNGKFKNWPPAKDVDSQIGKWDLMA